MASPLQRTRGMTISSHLVRWGSARLSRRLSRALPWVGTAVALVTVVSTMRKKGVVGGALDTGFNAMPVIGVAKNVIELARGKDFFPDRAARG
jgi:hypothetical protein